MGVVAAIWEAFCRAGLVSPVLLAPPSRIAAAGWLLLHSPSFGADARATLTAFALSLLLATLVGALLGAAMGASRLAYHALTPHITALNAVPKVALLPVVILCFGLGLRSAVFLATLAGSFPVAFAVYAGMRGLERDYVLLARAFGASRLKTATAVILPGLVPHLFGALRLAINYVLVGVLLVEFFASDRGVGYRMVVLSQNFQIAPFFALLVMVMGFAVALGALARLLEDRFTSWRAEVWP